MVGPWRPASVVGHFCGSSGVVGRWWVASGWWVVVGRWWIVVGPWWGVGSVSTWRDKRCVYVCVAWYTFFGVGGLLGGCFGFSGPLGNGFSFGSGCWSSLLFEKPGLGLVDLPVFCVVLVAFLILVYRY